MEEPKKYRIENVGDILKIPEESIDHFLVELKDLYNIMRPVQVLADTTGGKLTETGFTWTDDKARKETVNLRMIRS